MSRGNRVLQNMGLNGKADIKVSEEILGTIHENSKDDINLFTFINDLIAEELEHPGQWWQFKNTYKKLIHQYSEAEDENK